MGGEGLEVWDDELLPEGLCEQDDVALDTSKRRDELRLADECGLFGPESMSAALLPS